MDPISYGVAAKQKQRIEKVIAEPDSTSGVITVPQVIAAGETITVPAGRTAVLPNVQVDGTLNVQGDVFIPSGATMSKVVEKVASTDNAIVRFNGATGDVQNSGVIIDDSNNVTQNGTSSSQFSLNVGGSLKGWLYSGTSGTALASADYLTFNTNNTEKMRIDANGNVGIGVTPSAWGSGTKVIDLGIGTAIANMSSIASSVFAANCYYNDGWKYKNSYNASLYEHNGMYHTWSLAPSGTAGNAITWTNAMTLDNNQLGLSVLQFNAYGYGANNTFEFVHRTANKGFDWYVNAGSNRAMNLNHSGSLNVIGNITSGYNGSSFTGNTYIINYDTASNSYILIQGRNTSAGGSYVLESLSAGVRKSAILDNGTFQSATNSYGSTSDAKLKENVVDATPKLEKLMQVKVRNFNYIGDEHKQIGVVAQEIEKIFPSIVYETKDTKQVEVKKVRQVIDKEAVLSEDGVVLEEATYKDEEYTEFETVETGETTKNVKYSVIYMMLLKAMQEQQEIINDLKARVEVSEAK